MVNTALDFDTSYEDLEKPLFFSDRDSVRLMWEYINMGFQKMSTEILEASEDSHIKMQELNSIYNRTSTLRTKAKKKMIVLFRTVIEQDIKMIDAVL